MEPNLFISFEMKSSWPQAEYSQKHKFHFAPQIGPVSNPFYGVIFGWPIASCSCVSLCFQWALGDFWDTARTTPIACMVATAALFYASWRRPLKPRRKDTSASLESGSLRGSPDNVASEICRHFVDSSLRRKL